MKNYLEAQYDMYTRTKALFRDSIYAATMDKLLSSEVKEIGSGISAASIKTDYYAGTRHVIAIMVKFATDGSYYSEIHVVVEDNWSLPFKSLDIEDMYNIYSSIND